MRRKHFIIAAVCLFLAGFFLALGIGFPASAQPTAPVATPFQLIYSTPSPQDGTEIWTASQTNGFALRETRKDS